jgi:hypothetical protein
MHAGQRDNTILFTEVDGLCGGGVIKSLAMEEARGDTLPPSQSPPPPRRCGDGEEKKYLQQDSQRGLMLILPSGLVRFGRCR